MSKLMNGQKRIEETVVSGYQKIENAVVSGYQKVENTVVSGYKKVEDKFSKIFLPDDKEAGTGERQEGASSAPQEK